MSGVLKSRFNTVEFKKLIESKLVSSRSASILRLSWEKPEDYVKKLESYIGWRTMNDITATCFVIATYLAAARAVEKSENENKEYPYKSRIPALKKALEENKTQKLAELLGALAAPSEDKSKRIDAIQGQRSLGGFKHVFVELLKALGSETDEGKKKSQAEQIYSKFETKLKRVTPWVFDRRTPIESVQSSLIKVLDQIFSKQASGVATAELQKSNDAVPESTVSPTEPKAVKVVHFLQYMYAARSPKLPSGFYETGMGSKELSSAIGDLQSKTRLYFNRDTVGVKGASKLKTALLLEYPEFGDASVVLIGGLLKELSVKPVFWSKARHKNCIKLFCLICSRYGVDLSSGSNYPIDGIVKDVLNDIPNVKRPGDAADDAPSATTTTTTTTTVTQPNAEVKSPQGAGEDGDSSSENGVAVEQEPDDDSQPQNVTEAADKSPQAEKLASFQEFLQKLKDGGITDENNLLIKLEKFAKITRGDLVDGVKALKQVFSQNDFDFAKLESNDSGEVDMLYQEIREMSSNDIKSVIYAYIYDTIYQHFHNNERSGIYEKANLGNFRNNNGVAYSAAFLGCGLYVMRTSDALTRAIKENQIPQMGATFRIPFQSQTALRKIEKAVQGKFVNGTKQKLEDVLFDQIYLKGDNLPCAYQPTEWVKNKLEKTLRFV